MEIHQKLAIGRMKKHSLLMLLPSLAFNISTLYSMVKSFKSLKGQTFKRQILYFGAVNWSSFQHAFEGGVQRVHLLDGTVGGAILLELFTRDGIGTMVASDVYEGTRTAGVGDTNGIQHLLQPLEDAGVVIKRSNEQLLEEIDKFTVVQRDGSIIACAALFPFHDEKCGELAALAVAPECRGHGQGDKLLDYMEKKAISMGLERLFLLTTRTADWFVSRGFSECTIDSIPESRRTRINLTRGSKYYIKKLQPIYNRVIVD